MIKKIIMFAVFLSACIYAQRYSTPFSYTDFLRLRNYAIGANIGNGTNLNNQTIDNWAKTVDAQLNAIISDGIDTLEITVGNADSLGGVPASEYVVKDSIMTWDDMVDSLGYRTFEYYGAVGDGVTDDFTAVKNALNSGLNIVAASGKTYYISAPIVTNEGTNIYLRSSGSNPAEFISDYTGVLFTFSGASDRDSVYTIIDTASAGDTYIVLGSGEGQFFDIGDTFTLTSDQKTFWDVNTLKGELLRVLSVSNDTIRLESAVTFNYDPVAEAIVIYRTIPARIHIENIKITYPIEKSSDAIYVYYAYNPVIKDVEITDATKSGVNFFFCYQGLIDNITVTGADAITAGVDNGYGYGVVIYSSNYTITQNSHFFNCKRGVDVSSIIDPSIDNLVTNCFSYHDYRPSPLSVGDGFGTHTGAYNTVWDNNFVGGWLISAFNLRGWGDIIRNNKASGSIGYFASVYYGGTQIINNQYTSANYWKSVIDTSALSNQLFALVYVSANYLPETYNYVIIKGNTSYWQNSVNSATYGGATLVYSPLTTLYGLVLTNNNMGVLNVGENYYANLIGSGTDLTLKRSTISGNTVRADRGNYFPFAYNVHIGDSCFVSLISTDGKLRLGSDGSDIALINYGTGIFEGTAIADTVVISGATTDDKYLLTAYGDSVSYKDNLTAISKEDTLIVRRPYHETVVEDTVGVDLIANGTFGDATGWTLSDSASISGGTLNFSNLDGYTSALYSMTVEANHFYRVTYTVSSYDTGYVYISVGGYVGTPLKNADGTYSATVKVLPNPLLSQSVQVCSFPYNPYTQNEYQTSSYSIDNLSIYEITLSDVFSTPELTYRYWRFR